jgi:hypothetical protein
MKLFAKYYFTVILLLMVGFLLFRLFQNERAYVKFQDSLLTEMEEKNAELIDAEQRIYRGTLIIAEKDKRIQNLIDSMDHIKSISSVVRVVTNTVIDSIHVPFEVPIYIEKDGSNYLRVPQPFSKVEKWYSLSGKINITGILIDSLSYRNDFQIVTGIEDHGSWLKNTFRRNNPTVQIKDQNPFSRTETLHQIVVKDKPKRFSVIVGGGYDLRTGASFGIYGGYNIIRF